MRTRVHMAKSNVPLIMWSFLFGFGWLAPAATIKFKAVKDVSVPNAAQIAGAGQRSRRLLKMASLCRGLLRSKLISA
jgi:hypothetical protein